MEMMVMVMVRMAMIRMVVVVVVVSGVDDGDDEDDNGDNHRTPHRMPLMMNSYGFSRVYSPHHVAERAFVRDFLKPVYHVHLRALELPLSGVNSERKRLGIVVVNSS